MPTGTSKRKAFDPETSPGMTDLMVPPESLEEAVEEKGKWVHEWDTGYAKYASDLRNLLNSRDKAWVVHEIFCMRDDGFTVVWERDYFDPEKEGA